MEQQGWIVRSEIIWDKGFARPDSADDRPTVTHAKIFMLVKNTNYAYDADPLRVPAAGLRGKLSYLPKRPVTTPGAVKPEIRRQDTMPDARVYQNPLGRNCGTVWRCNVANYRGDHTATLPLPLVRRMVLASCLDPDAVVLDPFGGPATVAIAAMQCGFRAVSIDIHEGYTQEAKQRIARTPLVWEDEPAPSADPRIAELEADNAHLRHRVQLLDQQLGVSLAAQAIAGLPPIDMPGFLRRAVELCRAGSACRAPANASSLD
jgi:DNA modification methylase